MNQAGDVIYVAVIHRQTRVVTAAQLLVDGGHAVFQINAHGFVARDHNVIDRHFFQIKDAQQHILAAAGNTQSGLTHHSAQFFGGQLVTVAIVWIDAYQAQQHVADDVTDPDDGVEQTL